MNIKFHFSKRKPSDPQQGRGRPHPPALIMHRRAVVKRVYGFNLPLEIMTIFLDRSISQYFHFAPFID